jgi:predicted ArsR family transcriptional regulator
VKSARDVPTGAATDGRTRDRVARLLLETGPSTAASLGDRLGLSPAAVRRHLDALLADGTITTRPSPTAPARRGRGRPARLYTLTDAGHEAGPTAYSDLASAALRHLAAVGGPGAVEEFASGRAAALEERIRGAVEQAAPEGRLAALAAAMTSAGYAAGVSDLPSGAQICQHHCPVAHVAVHFPALCDAETAALARVLGTHVQRLATIAHGDGVCTTHVPSAGAAAPGPSGPHHEAGGPAGVGGSTPEPVGRPADPPARGGTNALGAVNSPGPAAGLPPFVPAPNPSTPAEGSS